VTLYQLLDEMLDSGIPVNTHPGGLKVLVPPPNLLNRVSSTMFGHQGVLVSDQDPLKLLPLPWRGCAALAYPVVTRRSKAPGFKLESAWFQARKRLVASLRAPGFKP
jgi:hypothetical protein